MLNALKARKALLTPSPAAAEAPSADARAPRSSWGALDYSKWDDIGNSSDENEEKESSSAASTLKDAINEAMRDLVPTDGAEEAGAEGSSSEGAKGGAARPEMPGLARHDERTKIEPTASPLVTTPLCGGPAPVLRLPSVCASSNSFVKTVTLGSAIVSVCPQKS